MVTLVTTIVPWLVDTRVYVIVSSAARPPLALFLLSLMKFILAVTVAVIVSVFYADYVREGTVKGVSLAREHMCR